MKNIKIINLIFALFVTLLVSSCGGGSTSATLQTYTVGGKVSGLSNGKTVVLNDNGGDANSITGGGTGSDLYTFATAISAGGSYAVSVVTQPAGMTCSVGNGAGSVASVNITTISVTCYKNPAFAYVANSGDNTVSAYTINPTTGALTSVGAPVATGISPRFVAVPPNGKFAYVTNQLDSTVSAYTINPINGGLSSVGAPVSTGSHPTGITVDPSSKFLYVANSNDNTVSAYVINSTTGALTPVGAAVATGNTPWVIASDFSGKFLFVT